MMLMANADLPLPGAPASSVSLARATRPGHSQLIGQDLSSLARIISAAGAVAVGAVDCGCGTVFRATAGLAVAAGCAEPASRCSRRASSAAISGLANSSSDEG
jgi:hypothetical protein